jgi:hypothetical protein
MIGHTPKYVFEESDTTGSDLDVQA